MTVVQSPSHAFLREVDSVDGVYALMLNRANAKNAISKQMLREIGEAIRFIASEPSARALIVASQSTNAFCAGADLKERQTMPKYEVDQFLVDIRRVFGELERCPVPTLAAIDGPALGGGLELALVCDFRIAARNVDKLGFPETRLGIIPGAGGTQRAPRLMGVTRAKELIFTGRVLNSETALSWGLVDYISVSGQSAFDRALELATEMAAAAPLAIRAAKVSMSRTDPMSIEEGLNWERACYEPLLETKDREEALVAFQEKRRPVYRGE